MAGNKFGIRHINLSPSSNCSLSCPPVDASCFISSRLFNRCNDSSYTALRTVFQLNSPLDSSANKHHPSLGAGGVILTSSNSNSSVNFIAKTSNGSSSCNSSNINNSLPSVVIGKNKGKKNKQDTKASLISLESVVSSSPSPLQPSNGVNISFNPGHPVLPSAGNKRKQTSKMAPSLAGLSAPSLTSLLETGVPSNSSPSFASLSNNHGSLVVNNSSGGSIVLTSSSSLCVGNKKMRTASSSTLSSNLSVNQNNGYISLSSAPTLESLLDAEITPSSSLLRSPSTGHAVGSEPGLTPSLSSTHSLLASTLESGMNASCLSSNQTMTHNHSQNTLLSSAASKQQHSMEHQESSRVRSSTAHNSPHLISLLDSGKSALTPSSSSFKRLEGKDTPGNSTWDSASFECQ